MPTQRLREKATRKRWCSTINWTHKSQILYLVHGKLRPPQTSFLCVFLDRCISTVSAEFQGLKLTTLCLGIANTRPLAQASGEHERQQGSKTGPVSQVSFQVKRAGSKFIIKSLHQSAEKWIYKENRPHENEQIWFSKTTDPILTGPIPPSALVSDILSKIWINADNLFGDEKQSKYCFRNLICLQKYVYLWQKDPLFTYPGRSSLAQPTILCRRQKIAHWNFNTKKSMFVGTVRLGSTDYFFSYFHFLCLIWHVIKRYGWELSTVQRWASNSQYWWSYGTLKF